MENHRNIEKLYTLLVSELHVRIHTVYAVIVGRGKLRLVLGGGGWGWKQRVPCNVVAHLLIPASSPPKQYFDATQHIFNIIKWQVKFNTVA